MPKIGGRKNKNFKKFLSFQLRYFGIEKPV